MAKKLRLSPYGYTEPINLAPKMMESSKDKGQSDDIEKLKKSTSEMQEVMSGIQESISGIDTSILNAFQGVSYDSEANEIQFTSASGDVVGSIDTTDFVKDGMIEDVSYNADTKQLDITFNTDGGGKTISVDLTDLFELQAGDGISVEGNKISIKLDESGDELLTLSENGLKLNNVSDLIEEKVDEKISEVAEVLSNSITQEEERAKGVEDEIKASVDALSEKVDNVEADIEVLSGDVETAKSDISSMDENIGLIKNDIDTISADVQSNRSGLEDINGAAFCSVEYNQDEKTLEFASIEGEIVGSVSVADFVKDGMISGVVYDAESKQLKLTFNVDGGGETISVDLKDLFDLVAGKGVEVNGNSISIKIDNSGEAFLSVSENGLKISGVSDAIGQETERAEAEESAIKSSIDYVSGEVVSVKEGLSAEEERATEKEQELSGIIVTALTDLQNEVERATEAESLLQDKDGELSERIDAVDAKKVDWVESTAGRKHIVLKNHDTILGTATDGTQYNLAMISKWDVADFGTSHLHANLNSKDGNVTINDNKVIATKDEVEAVDAKVSAIDLTPYATVETVNAELANKANVTDLTAAVNSLTEKDNELEASISQAAANAVAQVVANAPSDLDTLKEVADYIAADKTNAAEIETKLAELTAKDASQDEVINGKTDKVMNGTNGKALIFNETDGGGAKFEHNDGTWSFAGVNDGGENGIAGQIYALKKNASNKMEGTRIDVTKGAMYYTVGDAGATERLVAENEIAVKGDVTAEIAAAVEPLATKEEVALKADSSIVYTQEEVDALLIAKEKEIYNLTKIVGNMGGAVTYELPNEIGNSFNSLMANNGTVKLTDDVTTGRFGPGVLANNTVKLNLNNHDLNISGLTISSSTSAIASRGTENITIGGKGTIDAGEGMCIMANGADSVINLTGSTTVYKTNRSGGELIYCYAGTINITNGTFINNGEEKKFTLNCYDANYRNGTAKIVVTGGKFYDFDPGNNTAEGENTSFLADGYVSVPSTEVIDGVEHTIYTVKKA